ncbi:MAG: sugar ABC transporter permease [Thermomicrobiales bacterium]|nr:sugar ABC transporter permease [Thermomicrobiales bacterium]
MATIATPMETDRSGSSPKIRSRMEQEDIRAGRLMMLPALIIPILLAGVFIFGFYLTLRNRRLNRGDLGFVGLDNYIKLLQDERFWHSLSLTLKFTITDIAVELTLATMLALALSVPLRGVKVYRALLIVPLMTPPVVGALVWKVLYRSGNGGFFNWILWKLGLPMQGFIGDPTQAIQSLIVIDVWLFLPFVAIILLSGLQTLPQEQMDAARVDGANEWRIFWQIKLPYLVPFYIVALFFRAIDSLNVFDTIYGTTKGGPGDATRVLAINGYENAFPFFNISYGGAVFVALWVLCTVTGSLLYLWVKRSQQ